MITKAIREEIVTFGRLMVDHQLTKGSGGNISFYDRESGLMAITPTGYPLDAMTPQDIAVCDLEGRVLEGELKPSSEWRMHAYQYEARPDLQAVMHAHTTYATVFASLQEPILPANYMLSLAGPDVRCADYASFGTEELARNAAVAMKDRKACLLANHGVLAGGKDLADAFNVLEEVEYCAKIYWMARAIGEPVILPRDEMDRMVQRFQTYGQPQKLKES